MITASVIKELKVNNKEKMEEWNNAQNFQEMHHSYTVFT